MEQDLVVTVIRKGTDEPGFSLECTPQDTVLVLKAKISGKCGVEVHLQRLYFHSSNSSGEEELTKHSDEVTLESLAQGSFALTVTLYDEGEEAQYHGSAVSEQMQDLLLNSLARKNKRISEALQDRQGLVDIVFSFDT